MDLYVTSDGRALDDGRPTIAGLGGLMEALDRAAPAAHGPAEPVTVHLAGDTFYLDEPLAFTPDNAPCPIHIRALDGAAPVICGGRRIGGWQEARVNGVTAWCTVLDEVREGRWYFHQLVVDGQRRPRSRYPKDGTFASEEYEGDRYQMFEAVPDFGYLDAIPPFDTNPDMEVCFDHYWVHDRAVVDRIDFDSRQIATDRRTPMALRISSGDEFYFDNVLAKLSEPGEWHLERATGSLHYIPRPGERLEETEFLAPVADGFVSIAGDPEQGRHVESITFEGIEFSLCASAGVQNSPQAAFTLTGGIVLRGARDCALRNCTVRHAGQYAVDIREGCSRIEIGGCSFGDMGAGAIRASGTAEYGQEALHTREITMERNEMLRGGRIYSDAVGVLMIDVSRSVVADNHICGFHYSGISCGYLHGGFCENESILGYNLIEGNHVHRIGHGRLSDLGGIYLLGVQPGTRVRSNRVHDVRACHYGGSGIYLDTGASNIVVENNTVFDTQGPCLVLHFGRDNTVRNNIFVAGAEGVMGVGRRERTISGSTALNVAANILVTDGQPVFVGGYKYRIEDDEMRSNGNVIWNRSAQDLTVYDSFGPPFGIHGPHPFDAWLALGNDTLSVFDDPEFADVDGGDFRLAVDSCAYRVGFRDIA